MRHFMSQKNAPYRIPNFLNDFAFRAFFLLSFMGGWACLATEGVIDSLFRDLEIVDEINWEIEDRLPYHYNDMFMGGYFNMPSARMNDVGVVALGFAYIPPYRNYGATIQLLSRVEFGINDRVFIGILDPQMGKMGFGDFSDRGANLKIGILRKEDGIPYLPEIAIGFEDFYGTKRFHSFYAVATKSFLDWNLEISLGWGKGRLKGFFGGIGWTPFRQKKIPVLSHVTLIGEYDAIDYEHHEWEHPQGKQVRSRINLGISTTFFNVLQLNVNSLRGEEIAAFASASYPLGESKGLFPKIDNPPLYRSPIDLEPIGALRTEKELARELAFAFAEQGLNLYRVYLATNEEGKRVLWIKIVNVRYRVERELKERISMVLSRVVPVNISSVIVVIEADGIPSHEYQFRTLDLHRFREKSVSDFEFQVLSPMREPTSPPNRYEGSVIYHRSKRIWTLTVRPRLLTFFGSATGKFKYSLGIVSGPEGYLFDQLYYKVQGAYHVKSSLSDVGDMDLLNPSQLINVRSDSVRYYQTHTLSLEEGYIQKGSYFKKGWYGRLALGYFEVAYGGISAEVLYYKVGSNWAIGFEAAGVLKRKYHGLGFTTEVREFDGFKAEKVHYIGYQYFLDLYYEFYPLQLEFQLSIGKFLARDVGARFEVGRYFSSGFRFSIWYTWTNAHDIVNNQRYRDKGIAFVIPFDFFLKKSSRTMIGYALSVWLRDTGARSATGKRLYRTLHDERDDLSVN